MKARKTDGQNKNDSGKFKKAKRRLASHPKANPETLTKLAQKAEADIAERVAENPQASKELLESLSTHQVPDVRAAVSENKNTSPKTINKLSHDLHPDVRFRLAENPQIPKKVLGHLSKDDNPYVAFRAKVTLSALKSIAEQADELLMQEKFAQAEVLYQKLAAGLTELLGAHNREVGRVLHKLAAALTGEGKDTEASKYETRAQLIEQAHKEV